MHRWYVSKVSQNQPRKMPVIWEQQPDSQYLATVSLSRILIDLKTEQREVCS